MKRFASLVTMLAIVLGLQSAARAAEPELRWQTVKEQCEELGLQVTWYPAAESLMRRYDTGCMLLVEEGVCCLYRLNSGEKLVGPFDAFGEFNKNGLAPACQYGKWGMVDMDGNTVVDFTCASQREAELAGEPGPVFRGRDGGDTPPYALFTKLGTQLTEYTYKDHDHFANGFAMVTRDGKGWGFVDGNGKEVSGLIYRHKPLDSGPYAGEEDYGIFDENGFAVVCTDKGFDIFDRHHGWGMLSEPSPKRPWRAGYGLWGYVDAESGKVGFLDGGAQVVIQPQFDDRTDSKGSGQVYRFDDRKLADVYENGNLYTIDLRGNRVDRDSVPWELIGEDALHEAFRRVQTGENGLWGFVDPAGEMAIPALFDAVGYFNCGYASVLVDGVYGLLRNPLLTEGGTGTSADDISFSDVPAGSWFEKGVMTCARSGIMVGTGDGTFSPNATLTDAECAMLAYRIYDQTHGGNGSLMKMPQSYGYIKLVSDNGRFAREGYIGERGLWDVQNIHYSYNGYRLCVLQGYSGGSDGPATLTFEGKEYRGMLQPMHRGSGRYEQDRFLGFEPKDQTLNALLRDAFFESAPPTLWWSDLLYTIRQKGWDDVFSGSMLLYGHEESRGGFAQQLGKVTNLPRRFDVLSLPDRERADAYDEVYALYEAGIIGGTDAYGTFEYDKTLTRAEAAVMAARILDESQRLAVPPRPMPKEGEEYTLTYLRDGVFADMFLLNDTYPYCVVGEYKEGSSFASAVGLLTLEGEYTPWTEELEEKVKVPYGWRNWGGLQVFNIDYYSGINLKSRQHYCWSDGTPATEKFDFCGKIGPDGRGFVQKDGKIYRIQFDLTSEKAVLRPERPTVPPDVAEGTEYLYDFNFYDRYGAKVDRKFSLMGWDEERETAIDYALLMPVEGALEGATAESADADGLSPYQLKSYKQESLDGDLVLGVHSYPLDGIEYISYLWTDRPSVVTDQSVGVGIGENELVWRYSRNLRLIEKDEAELDWMSSHSSWDFDELYVWQPFTLENNDCRDITFYMKDRKVVAIEMTSPMELRYIYGHDKDEELRRAEERRQAAY